MGSQTIRLSVPAEPTYARSVRMMAANLAVVSGMSVDAVEDVRMAVEEGFVYSCATGGANCDITFQVSASAVAIDFSLGAEEPSEDATGYATLLLGAVCDEFDVDPSAAVLHLLMRAEA